MLMKCKMKLKKWKLYDGYRVYIEYGTLQLKINTCIILNLVCSLHFWNNCICPMLCRMSHSRQDISADASQWEILFHLTSKGSLSGLSVGGMGGVFFSPKNCYKNNLVLGQDVGNTLFLNDRNRWLWVVGPVMILMYFLGKTSLDSEPWLKALH